MRARRRISAVRYLNTTPLIWGFLHGPQQGIFDLEFSLPSECADALRSGKADIGLAPIIALARQPDLIVVPGRAVACRGPVRSILLLSRKPLEAIESFAADTSSRTSVALAQILLARKFGIRPRVRPYPPKLDEMLELADAALIIGDPALHIDPGMTEWRGQPLFVHDLGAEWVELTGGPMVFAVWAVKNLVADASLQPIFEGAAQFGQEHLDDIVEIESQRRALPADLVRRYLTDHISYELGEAERRSMTLFLRSAAELGLVDRVSDVPFLEEAAVAERE
jgi:predicted solute-binding protein